MLIYSLKYAGKINYANYNVVFKEKAIFVWMGVLSQSDFRKNEYLRLLKIQNYINQKYNTKINILSVIRGILCNFYFDVNGLNLNSYKEQNISIEIIYKLLSDGALECPRYDTFKELIEYVLNYLRLLGD